MTLNSRCYAWVLIVMCVVMCGCNGEGEGDGEVQENVTTSVPTTPPPTFSFSIIDQCRAVRMITQLDVVAGQTVEYCNNWNVRAELKFSVPGFLPDGALTVILEPGQCVTHVVDASVADGEYAWTITCEGYTGPGGGGPVVVDNPPPGP